MNLSQALTVSSFSALFVTTYSPAHFCDGLSLKVNIYFPMLTCRSASDGTFQRTTLSSSLSTINLLLLIQFCIGSFTGSTWDGRYTETIISPCMTPKKSFIGTNPESHAAVSEPALSLKRQLVWNHLHNFPDLVIYSSQLFTVSLVSLLCIVAFNSGLILRNTIYQK